MRRTVVLAAVIALGLTSAATSAPPLPGCRTTSCPETPSATPVVRSGSMGVGVSGTGTTSGGGSFTIPARQVYVPPVCYYTKMGTGAEYARALNNGLEDSVIRMLPGPERRTPLPGWEEHQDKGEADGAWWIPTCDEAERFDAYNARNDPVFVVPGAAPPVGEVAVPPELLAQVAYEAMDLPTGTIRWNPSLAGSGATVVNLDTWVWVEGGPTSVSITASVPGVSATVDAVLDHLVVGAPGADSGRCAGAGVAWSEGAVEDGACRVVFFRSSANQAVKSGQSLPTATVTATATWTASWTSSLDPTRRDLPAQDLTASVEVPVAEIQSIVTSR